MSTLSTPILPARPQAPYLHVPESIAIPDSARGCVLAIGNFDGVHRGHQAVLGEMLELAENYGVPAYALTFEPHPRTLFLPDNPVFRLTNETEKARLFEAVGLDGDIVRGFTREFAGQSADGFVQEILIDQINVRHVVTGFDFHFGKNRQGSPEFLRSKGRDAGFGVTIVEAFGDEAGDAVSSSHVRRCLGEGEVVEAAGLLGYRWFFTSEIVHGEKRGRGLGYPTANMQLAADCKLKHGVYAVRVTVDGQRYDGVANYGRRPMFDNGRPLFETHLFDFSGDLYGRKASISLFGFLRDEEKFDSVDELVTQMKQDSEEARALLSGITPLSAIDLDIHFS